MESGFNTNVRHRGVLFHVQTEDSGRKHPHIITHLYYGGTILSSEKSQYRDQLDVDDVAGLVKELMEKQHKEMLERLKRGEFNSAIEERLDADIFTDRSETTGSSSQPQAAAAPAKKGRAAPRRVRAFGEGIGTEKPLDQVVLDYLVEKTRKRKSSAG